MSCSNCNGGGCWTGGPARNLHRPAVVPPLPFATDDQAPLPTGTPGPRPTRTEMDRRRIERLRREMIRKSLGKS